MNYHNVAYEVRNKIGWITLNRPAKLNAVNDAMLAELDDVIKRAEPDLEAKVIVIKGAGRAFSTGQDLSGEGTSEVMPPDPRHHLPTRQLQDAFRRWNRRWEHLFNIPKPTIAQVHGYCLGVGCYLTMVCDITVAAEDAVFGDPSLRMGLLPAMPLLPWLIGNKKARELLYTGRYFSGKEAEKLGLVNKAVPRAKLEEEVLRLAEGMSLLPTDTLAVAKDSVNSVMEARGVGAAWRFTGEMQILMQRRALSKGDFNFYQVREEKGLKAAIAERDAPFKGILW